MSRRVWLIFVIPYPGNASAAPRAWPAASLAAPGPCWTVAGLDYLTALEDWRNIQNRAVAGQDQFDSRKRYIRNGRDLGQYVHVDALYEAYLNACLILLDLGVPGSIQATPMRPPPSRTPSVHGVAHTS